jgi:hypothetical protein
VARFYIPYHACSERRELVVLRPYSGKRTEKPLTRFGPSLIGFSANGANFGFNRYPNLSSSHRYQRGKFSPWDNTPFLEQGVCPNWCLALEAPQKDVLNQTSADQSRAPTVFR